MRLRAIETERFQDYILPSFFIASCFCDYKCCKEQGVGVEVCQNAPLSQIPIQDVPDEDIFAKYIKDPITKAVVIGGLEPMLQFDEIQNLIQVFRSNGCDDTFVIYTGYYEPEIPRQIEELKKFRNIVIKFGRYIDKGQPVYDKVLGVTLASNNQHAEKIS